MAVSDLTSAAQDYLKVIWACGEWSTAPVTTKQIAERVGVRPPSVSDAVRRHRLLETFLVRELGYGWDEVHDEAEVLEHAVSDLMRGC